MCDCPLSELYAKAAKERDEAVKLRRKAEERADYVSRKLEVYVAEANRLREEVERLRDELRDRRMMRPADTIEWKKEEQT